MERLLTLAGIVGGIVVPFVLGAVLTATRADPEWLFIGLPFMGMLWVASLYAPRGYVLAPDGVRIERRVGDIVVPYAAIVDVDRARRGLSGIGPGSSGFLGWFTFGHAWRWDHGRFRLCLTNRRDAVWIRTSTDWIAVSPDPPDVFVLHLRARLARR